MEKTGQGELTFESLGVEPNDAETDVNDFLKKPLSVAKSGIDLNVSGTKLQGSLLVEIREYQDITQPKQRFVDDKSAEVDVSPCFYLYFTMFSLMN